MFGRKNTVRSATRASTVLDTASLLSDSLSHLTPQGKGNGGIREHANAKLSGACAQMRS